MSRSSGRRKRDQLQQNQSSINASIESYGIYQGWTGDAGVVPKVTEFTDTVPAIVGIEFGYVLRIQGAKGILLDWSIEHPPFKDSGGRKTAPPFIGTYQVKAADFTFFLGDTIWEPWNDKVGDWILTTSHKNQILARQVIHIVPP